MWNVLEKLVLHIWWKIWKRRWLFKWLYHMDIDFWQQI